MPNLYGGFNYDYTMTLATDINPIMETDSNYLLHGSEVFNSGMVRSGLVFVTMFFSTFVNIFKCQASI